MNGRKVMAQILNIHIRGPNRQSDWEREIAYGTVQVYERLTGTTLSRLEAVALLEVFL